MSKYQPKKIFIEKAVVNSSVTKQILNKLPDVIVEYIDDYRSIRIEGNTTDDVYIESKECLAIQVYLFIQLQTILLVLRFISLKLIS